MNTTLLSQHNVPDGYFGATCMVNLVFDADTGSTYEVYPLGYHNSPVLQKASSVAEAVWLRDNHPTCKDRYK